MQTEASPAEGSKAENAKRKTNSSDKIDDAVSPSKETNKINSKKEEKKTELLDKEEEKETAEVSPTTEEEVEEQLDSILYMIGQLQQLRSRNKFIAVSEVTNLRKAFQFATGEADILFRQSKPIRAKSQAIDKMLLPLEKDVQHQNYSRSFHGSWRSVFHTPGVRRLQSISISIFTFFVGIPLAMFVTLLFLYCYYTRPFMILYLVYIFTFGRPKHPMPKRMKTVRHIIWKHYRDYFPVRLVIPRATRRKFDPQKNYLFAYHPHGIHTFGAISCFGTDANFSSQLLPGIRTHLQTLGVNYYIPFWRWCMLSMGAGDASADCLRRTLRAGPGESVVLVVGGAEESLMSRPRSNNLLLHKRKGFVKIALQEGASLVPVYGFGENNAYELSSLSKKPGVQMMLRLLKKYTGFTIPLVSGRGFFFKYGILPHRRPIVVVVGDPIDLPRIASPTTEDIQHWHQVYVEALVKLFNEHHEIYDLESTGLKIMK